MSKYKLVIFNDYPIHGQYLYRVYKKGLIFWPIFPTDYTWAKDLDEAETNARKSLTKKNEVREFTC